MAVNLSPVGGVAGQFFDNNGNPLSGGKIFTYAAGTTTNQATYTSAAGVIAHSNPIILDSGGRVPSGEIWLTDGLQYKFVIKTSTDQLIGTFDNITGINSNFINFLAEEEIQVATAGQTVFTLTTMQYQPGTNSLTVFVDGVNQYDGSSYAYVETSSTVVTFTAGLHVGALVKFTTAQTLSSGATDASLVTYDPPFVDSVPTNVENKLAQTISVEDFGAVCDGVADDAAAIQDALDYAFSIGGAVVTANGSCKVSTDVLVKANVTFNFNQLIPSTASNSVLRIYGGATVRGTIDTSAFPAYSAEALIVDGAGEVNGSIFRLHVRTVVDVSVLAGGLTGKAIYFKATTTNARIMGVQLNARISGFRWGVYLEQTSADLSRFITSNYINVDSSDTLIAIEMVSSQANFYGIDGNNFIAKGQPTPGTTDPLYKLCGQDNIFDLLPWDWDAQVGTAPFAGVLEQFSRRNIFYWRTDFDYFDVNSTDLGNFFFALFENTIKVYSLTGYATAGVMPIKDVSVRLDNNKFFSGSKADATNQLLLGVDTSNNTILECASGGVYAFRINSVNRALLSPTAFTAGADNVQSLGSNAVRWSVVYAATGTINTSDGTTKQQIRDLSDAEKAVALRCKGLLKAFKFNDSVETKTDGARWHFGIVAQDVKAAFEAEDLNAEDYGVFCSDTLEDGSVRLGVRYDELFAFILGAM
jgi:hypothetical protein